MSFLSFCPALHVPLGSRKDASSRGVGALCTIVTASGSACPTVVDGRLQVLVVGPGGRNGAGWWQNGWCGGAGSGSASAASSSTAAPTGLLSLQGSDKLGVHSDKLLREPFDRGRELGNGGVSAGCGCCQVRDGVHRILLQVPVVWVYSCVVCGAVGSAGLVVSVP